MKNLKKLKIGELKNVIGGIAPEAGCLPCDVFCNIPAEERLSCNIVYIVAHCNGCKNYPSEILIHKKSPLKKEICFLKSNLETSLDPKF